MTNSFIRAALFAVLSLILLAVLSAVAMLFLVGMPKGPAGMAEFQAQAAAIAPRLDLILGFFVLLLCAWLAARPFAGRDAVQAAALVALVYIVLDAAIVLLFGDVRQMKIETTGLSYAVKIAGALIGGWLASRTPAAVVVDESAALDKE